MRSRIHNIVLLASMLLTFVAITSCNNSPEGSDEELTLLIKLSPKQPFRAIEEGAKQDAYEVGDFQSITLFFYDALGNPTEPYRVELKSTADIQKAMRADGYEIKVRQAVRKVSAVAGRSGVWKAADLDKITIDQLQKLSGAEAQKNGFLYKVPYVAPVTDVETDLNNAERLIVTLQPVPNVARLEISGNIEVPLESQESTVKWIIDNKMKTYTQSQTDYSWLPTPEDLMLRSISDVTIRGIYVNNYKETPNVANADRTRLTDDNYNLDGKVWTGHNDAMHTLFGALNETNDYAKKMTTGKVDAYQIYPGKATDDPEALDHIIVAVDYKVHTRVGHFNYKVYNATEKKDVYACTGVEDRGVQTKTRFITIRKFLVTDTESLVSFDAGKIYRINLKDLSPLFSTNTNPGIKGTDDIKVIAPRPERTDERPEEETNTIPVSVVDWTHININTTLD